MPFHGLQNQCYRRLYDRVPTGKFAKTQGKHRTLYARVVNSLILSYRISDICSDILDFFKISFAYEIVANFCYWHREFFQSDRENTGNLQIGSEWGLCMIILPNDFISPPNIYMHRKRDVPGRNSAFSAWN